MMSGMVALLGGDVSVHCTGGRVTRPCLFCVTLSISRTYQLAASVSTKTKTHSQHLFLIDRFKHTTNIEIRPLSPFSSHQRLPSTHGPQPPSPSLPLSRIPPRRRRATRLQTSRPISPRPSHTPLRNRRRHPPRLSGPHLPQPRHQHRHPARLHQPGLRSRAPPTVNHKSPDPDRPLRDQGRETRVSHPEWAVEPLGRG